MRNAKVNLLNRSKTDSSTVKEESQLNLQWAELINMYIEKDYSYYYPFSPSSLLTLQTYGITLRQWNAQILQNQIIQRECSKQYIKFPLKKPNKLWFLLKLFTIFPVKTNGKKGQGNARPSRNVANWDDVLKEQKTGIETSSSTRGSVLHQSIWSAVLMILVFLLF